LITASAAVGQFDQVLVLDELHVAAVRREQHAAWPFGPGHQLDRGQGRS
jgi:hypothetical protein